MKQKYGRNLSAAGNHKLELNITSIGNPVAKLWPFLYIQDGRQPPSGNGFYRFVNMRGVAMTLRADATTQNFLGGGVN